VVRVINFIINFKEYDKIKKGTAFSIAWSWPPDSNGWGPPCTLMPWKQFGNIVF
jgi:hypothetical protein